MRIGEIDYWEVNEAFSVVDLANRMLLDLDPERWAGHSPFCACLQENREPCVQALPV